MIYINARVHIKDMKYAATADANTSLDSVGTHGVTLVVCTGLKIQERYWQS